VDTGRVRRVVVFCGFLPSPRSSGPGAGCAVGIKKGEDLAGVLGVSMLRITGLMGWRVLQSGP